MYAVTYCIFILALIIIYVTTDLIVSYFYAGNVKVCFGGLNDPPSSHILVIFQYRDSHRIGSCIYDSAGDKWTHLPPFDFLLYVWNSNCICIDGVIYLLSRAPPNSKDPFDYVISYDIMKAKYSRFRCPEAMHRQICSLINYKSRLGVIVQNNFVNGLRSYNARLFGKDHARNTRLFKLSCSPCFTERTYLFGFIDSTYILDETNEDLRRPEKVPGVLKIVFWNPDGLNVDKVVEIPPADALWNAVNIFEYQESFRHI